MYNMNVGLLVNSKVQSAYSGYLMVSFQVRMSGSVRSTRFISFIHSFIHSGHFYSASSSPLLLRGIDLTNVPPRLTN